MVGEVIFALYLLGKVGRRYETCVYLGTRLLWQLVYYYMLWQQALQIGFQAIDQAVHLDAGRDLDLPLYRLAVQVGHDQLLASEVACVCLIVQLIYEGTATLLDYLPQKGRRAELRLRTAGPKPVTW
jgi:hypothetical protein